MTLADLTGSIGVGLLLAGFLLALLGKIQQGGIIYCSLNVAGAGLACVASVLLMYWPFILLEGAWTAASLIALIKALPKR